MKETTATTLIAALFQVIGLAILIISGHFTLPLLIFVRTVTEGVMAGLRIGYVYHFRTLFNGK